MNDQDRIKLAEFCGWTRNPDDDLMLAPPGDDGSMGWCAFDIPGMGFCPDTDADDCEALIRALKKALYDLEIRIGWANDDGVVIRWIDGDGHRVVDFWKGANYKQGVCELALKVIDAADDRQEPK